VTAGATIALSRADARPCSRCKLRPRARAQRWCRECHAAYKRKATETARETETGARNGQSVDRPHSARQATPGVVAGGQTPAQKERPEPVAPPAPYLPYDGLEPDPAAPPREPWYGVFLRDMAERGLMSLAAARARVHISKVRRRRTADPAFAEEIEVARDYYKSFLEWQSVELGRVNRNPLPFFARLKAELPARYIDKATMLVASFTGELPAEDGKALLLAMFGQGAGATHPALEVGGALPAHVVEDEPSGTRSDAASAD
jgi:hypothetical protein